METLKDRDEKIKEILFCKEKELCKAKEIVSGLEKEIERIFEFDRNSVILRKRIK